MFLTGVPGSQWSAIAQDIETVPGINTSDKDTSRTYNHHSYSGHSGAYFGTGMEFSVDIESMGNEVTNYFTLPFTSQEGTKILKSHEWAYRLPYIKKTFPDDWIMLVYRPDLQSQAWWHEAGGFNGIKYPNYECYKDSTNMFAEIMKQNQAILTFAYENNAQWSHYNNEWMKNTFGVNMQISLKKTDILVTVIK
jgi:hypothetical protein